MATVLPSIVFVACAVLFALPIHAAAACGDYVIDAGCASAPPYGSFLNASFFNPAAKPTTFEGMLQAQQTYSAGSTPLTASTTQNVAGVTYGVGIPAAAVFEGDINGVNLAERRLVYGGVTFPQGYNVTIDEMHGWIKPGTHITGLSTECAGTYIACYTVDTAQTLGPQTFYVYYLRSPDGIQGDQAGCTFSVTTPTGANGPIQQVLCGHGAVVDIEQYDFSPSNVCASPCTAGQATWLAVNDVTSFKVANSKFVMDATLNSALNTSYYQYSPSEIHFNVTGFPDEEDSNIFDSCAVVDPYCPVGFNDYLNLWTTGARPSTGSGTAITSGKSGNTTTKYNAFLGTDGRPYARAHTTCVTATIGVVNPSCDSYLTEYNYIGGMNYGTYTVHAEYDLAGAPNGCASLCGEVYKEDFEYNTFGFPANGVNGLDGVIVNAWTNGTSANLTFKAGTLSPLLCLNASVWSLDGGLPPGTTISSFNNGSLAAATEVTLTNAPALGVGSHRFGFYESTPPTSCTTGITAAIAPFATSYNSGVQMDNVIVNGNVVVTNVSGLGNYANQCTQQASAGLPCWPVAGVAAVYFTHDYVLNASITDNWIDPSGSFEPYAVMVSPCSGCSTLVTAAFVAGSNTLTTTINYIPQGWWVVDSPGGTFEGGSPPEIMGTATSIGPCSLGLHCYTYALSNNALSDSPQDLISYRNANPVFSGNIDMVSGSACNSAFQPGSMIIANHCGGEYP